MFGQQHGVKMRRSLKQTGWSQAVGSGYGARDSGKTCLEEIATRDIEAFIEHEQDRRLMLSTVRTKLHCINAFLGYAIDTGVVGAEVLARRIRLKKPETLPHFSEEEEVPIVNPVKKPNIMKLPRGLPRNLKGPRDRAMFMVMLRCGLRVEEVVHLFLGNEVSHFHRRVSVIQIILDEVWNL